MSDAKPPFAELVRARMQERGVGLRQLCRDVGVDPSYFSKVLAGKRSPPAEERMLRAIARSLELDPPRLVVAAGRIPAEWEALFDDERLFASVHRIAAGASTPAFSESAAAKPAAAQKQPAKPRRSNWRTAPSRPAPRRDFGEELL